MKIVSQKPRKSINLADWYRDRRVSRQKKHPIATGCFVEYAYFHWSIALALDQFHSAETCLYVCTSMYVCGYVCMSPEAFKKELGARFRICYEHYTYVQIHTYRGPCRFYFE